MSWWHCLATNQLALQAILMFHPMNALSGDRVKMKNTNSPRGFTIVELMVVVAIIALLISLLVPALASSFASAKATQDQAQVRGVMAGTLQSASDFNDKFVSPDRIARKPYTGGAGNPHYVWGKGERIITWNSTESLCSALIMREYLEPSAFVSPVDVNPYVGAKGQVEEAGGNAVPYNFDCWDPVSASGDIDSTPHGFWDTAFHCDLAPNTNEADHNSYANSMLCGHRLKKWNANQGHDRITWGTRGTRMGATVGEDDYDNSPGLEMLGEDTLYKVHVTHADGSVTTETNFMPVLHYSVARGLPYEDNIYDAEFCEEYFMPGSGQAGCFGAGDNFLTYSNNGYASGSPSQLFPNGMVLDSYAMGKCTWDTDMDY
jgi:prepilin-type N-terminal cleavage/methylation domain-containing protein